MSRRLTTVATFDVPVKADLARNALDAAGISATVADSQIVLADWMISNAVGGVKVQVWEEDAERAAEVLAERFGDVAGTTAEDLDEEELTRQALAAVPEDRVEELGPDVAEIEPEVETRPGEVQPIDRDAYAWRAFVVAWFANVIWPLAFVALYLFVRAAFGSGRLSRFGRIRLVVVAILLSFSLSMCAVLIHLFVAG